MLQLDQLHKRYGRHEVLTGLTFSLDPGEIFGLLGPNGAGKSTTLKIVTGLVHADRGEVRIDGRSLREDPMAALASVGAQVDQPAAFDHLSARANLELLALLHDGPVDPETLLEAVGLSDRAEDRAGTFSTGMRQRLGIAAALVGSPRLLILDEPTSGLDPEGRQGILDLIRELVDARGLTVLFTSHIFDEVARLCDRVGILHDGRLAHEGPVENADELRAQYFARAGAAS